MFTDILFLASIYAVAEFVSLFFVGVRKTGPKGEKIMYDMECKINEAVFPGLQGSRHDNTIAGSESSEFLHYGFFFFSFVINVFR